MDYTAHDIELLQRIATNRTKLMVLYHGNLLDSISSYHLIELGYLSGVPGNDPNTESFILTVTDAGHAFLRQLAAEAKQHNASWGPLELAYHKQTMSQAMDEQCLREAAYTAGYTDGIAAVTLSNEEIDAINEAFSKIDVGPIAAKVMAIFSEIRRQAEKGSEQ